MRGVLTNKDKFQILYHLFGERVGVWWEECEEKRGPSRVRQQKQRCRGMPHVWELEAVPCGYNAERRGS